MTEERLAVCVRDLTGGIWIYIDWYQDMRYATWLPTVEWRKTGVVVYLFGEGARLQTLEVCGLSMQCEDFD